MPISNNFPTSELEKDLQIITADLEYCKPLIAAGRSYQPNNTNRKQAERWTTVVMSIFNHPPGYLQALKHEMLKRNPDLQSWIERHFQQLAMGVFAAQMFKEHVEEQQAQKAQANAVLVEQSVPPAPVEERSPIHTIAVDPELARLASGLKLAPQFRLWMVLLEMVRNTNHLRVSRADLEAALPDYGVKVSKRNLRRWLAQGQGVFWNFTDTFIYFIGYEKVAHALVKVALEQDLPDLVNTNPPGRRGMYIDVSGSLQRFEAHIYAAWLAYRETPMIARSTLSALFNRAPRILRQWEQLAAIKVITNEAQYDTAWFPDVPEHAYMYQASIGKGRTETHFRARLSNSYRTGCIRQHLKRGQSRRVFRTIGEYLESIEPAGGCERDRGNDVPIGGLKPTGRRYFATRKKVRSHSKHCGDCERYLFLGEDRYKRMIWDYVPDGRQRTRVGEELPLRRQRKFTPQAVYARDAIYN